MPGEFRPSLVRAAIVGIGGVGSILARELSADSGVSSLLLVDNRPIPKRELAPIRTRAETDFLRLDASRGSALVRAIRGCDLVANTSLPFLNLTIMKAALEAGADYLDVAATGPRKPGGLPGILEQLRLRDSFAKEGRTALLSMGLDPGMSNVMAREAADRLDTVDEIRIRSGGTVRVRGRGTFPRFVPLYSREAFFSDLRITPTVWESGRLVEREPFSGEEQYEFPPPVGPQTTFYLAHEEVKTLPLCLGKPVGRVDFKYAVNPDLASAMRALGNLGVFAERHSVEVGGRRIPFRAAFESVFPEPVTVAHRLEGTKCLSVDVEGVRGGVRKILHEDIALSHEAAIRRRGTSAVYYLTGVAAAIGVRRLGRGDLRSPGVYPAEALVPEKVFAEWAARRLPISRLERSAPN